MLSAEVVSAYENIAPWTPMVLLPASTQPSVGTSGTPSGSVAVLPPEPVMPPLPALPEPFPATATGPEPDSLSPPSSQPTFARMRIERPNREPRVLAMTTPIENNQ